MLQRILKLARDNERVVIVDPETEHAFVVLPLSTYEQLVDESAFDEEEFDTIDDDWVAPVDNVGWREPGTDEAGSYRPDTLVPTSRDSLSGLQDDSPEASRLTEQSLIDSIDRDIAAWKAAQERMSEEQVLAGQPAAAPATGGSAYGGSLDELTLTPVPGDEAPMKPPASAEDEKFYIEPVA